MPSASATKSVATLRTDSLVVKRTQAIQRLGATICSWLNRFGLSPSDAWLALLERLSWLNHRKSLSRLLNAIACKTAKSSSKRADTSSNRCRPYAGGTRQHFTRRATDYAERDAFLPNEFLTLKLGQRMKFTSPARIEYVARTLVPGSIRYRRARSGRCQRKALPLKAACEYGY